MPLSGFTALADLPTILQIVTSILSIVSATQGGVVSASVLATVNKYGDEAKSDLQTAQTLITSYQAAASSAKPGILGQIDAALIASENNLNAILTAFHVSDTTLEATIAAALGSAITIVLAIQLLIPPPPAAPATRLAMAKPSDQSAAMKAAYNLIVGKNYPSAVVR
jgi:hypothetical protein